MVAHVDSSVQGIKCDDEILMMAIGTVYILYSLTEIGTLGTLPFT